MEVRLSRIFWIILCLSISVSCGKKMDIETEYGRQARVDETNSLLSQGYCQLAQDTIKPLYESVYNNSEATILMAATYACFASFDFLTLANNLATVTNKFQAISKTMPSSSSSDARINYMYSAVDVLTANRTLLSATSRDTSVNAYMLFLQLGLMGSIMSGYGAPSTTTGAQVSNLTYSNPRAGGEMSNVDACALAAAVSTIVDCSSAVTGNSDITSALSSLTTACTNAGFACTAISQDRTSCTGVAAETNSVRASAIVGAINTSW